jgi:hypothetical protein
MKTTRQPPSPRKSQPVCDAGARPWPVNAPGYTFLGDVVREVYERLFPGSFGLSDERLFAAIGRIRQDALAGRLALGHFDGEVFAPLAAARLKAREWRQLFLSCSAGGADIFVRDRELVHYVKFIDGVRAAG